MARLFALGYAAQHIGVPGTGGAWIIETTPQMKTAKLQLLINAAVDAINAAESEAQRLVPGATLYLESAGTLFAMEPEPAEHMRRDTTTGERQSLIFASSDRPARCDVGAW